MVIDLELQNKNYTKLLDIREKQEKIIDEILKYDLEIAKIIKIKQSKKIL